MQIENPYDLLEVDTINDLATQFVDHACDFQLDMLGEASDQYQTYEDVDKVFADGFDTMVVESFLRDFIHDFKQRIAAEIRKRRVVVERVEFNKDGFMNAKLSIERKD